MKRILLLILTAVIAVSILPICASAAQANGIPVYLNGQEIKFDVPAQILSDRTMVPLRAVFEAFDATVDWNDATKTVTSKYKDTTVSFTIGADTLIKNGEKKPLDVPAQIVDSRTLIPLRAVAESFGFDVFWEADKRIVRIRSFSLPDAVLTEKDNARYMKIGEYTVSKALHDTFASVFEDPDVSNSTIMHIYANIEYGEKNGMLISSVAKDYADYLISRLVENGTYNKFVADNDSTDAAMREFLFVSSAENTFAENIMDLADNLTDDEIVAFAEKNCIKAKHILVKDEEKAKEILSEAKAGKSFEELIKAHSIDSMDADKGYVFSRGDMVKEFEDAAFALKDGEISDVVKSEYGYHIIKKYPMTEVSREELLSSGTRERIANALVVEKYGEEIVEIEKNLKIEK